MQYGIFLTNLPNILANGNNRVKMIAKEEVSSTSLKKKIENNSNWEGAFYQSEWDKVNWCWVILDFSLYVCCC